MLKIDMNKKTGLFIMPRSSSDWRGSEALWITVAGWAAAAERKFGKAYILTTDRVATPKEVLQYPLGTPKTLNSNSKKISSFLPIILITLIKDIILWKSSMNNDHYDYELPDMENGVSLVWEQHDFFPGIGYKLAKKHNVPFIIYAHAPQVWEAAKWGVKRPVWGKLLEKMETRSLKRADIVACVSQQVADKLKRMGIPKNKILVSPMAVDAHLFTNINSQQIIDNYNLKDKFIIGWTGSFRSFHGLDILMKVFQKVHDSINVSLLMLVGDGAEKEETMKMAEDLGVKDAVVFTGRKSFTEIPNYVNAFDLAIVSARNASDFHYSPLKLREYLGAGKATLAPNAGEIPKMFRDDIHLKLYNVGDIEGTAQKIIELYTDEEKRNLIAIKGREHILKHGTWDVELEKLMNKTK
jgi:glycosyltransferase involved in cell wall biosynthesis